MKFQLTIDMNNDAFYPDHKGELLQILQTVATCINNGRDRGNLLDSNGTSVGHFSIEEVPCTSS